MINLNSNLIIKILGYCFINSNEEFYGRQLAKIFEVDPGNLSKKLDELAKEGFLSSSVEGRQKYFILNKDYPLLAETKKIYESKCSIALVLKDSLNKINNLKEAYLFGSYLKDSFNRESDIDLLLVGDHNTLEARRKILPLQKKLGREINIIDFSSQEFKEKKSQSDDFLNNIFSGQHLKLI
jgi:predicted nucleotidyltransferase